MSDIRGVIPPIITPYEPNGQIHEKAFATLVDWYAEAGCHGLWVCGGTGEGIALSLDERLQMVELSAECAVGRLKVMFHVGATTTQDAVAVAQKCQRLGLDAISSVPPFFYGKSDAEVLDYYRRLGEESDLPLFIYNLPDATGYSLSPALIQRIHETVPNVAGIKHSSGRLDELVEIINRCPDLTVIIGRGELTLSSLVVGAAGVVCASLCMAPERFLAVYDAFQNGSIQEAVARQREATAVKDLFHKYPVVASTKRVNELQIGLDCGPPRPPAAAIAEEEDGALQQMARRLGLLPVEAARQAATSR